MDIANKKIYYPGLSALRLEWPAEQSVNYGVVINFDEEQENNEVKYQLRLTRLKPVDENQALFQIERISDVFINETLPDFIADRLAYAAGKVFYPLVVSVDHNGGFESIYNHKEILSRWPTVKNKILDNFEGDLVEDYLLKMEQQLSSQEKIQIAFLNHDWFLHTFFRPIYKEYGRNHSVENIYKFPIVRDFKIEGYQTIEKLSAETNDFGGIELLHEGTILPVNDEYFAYKVAGSYEGYYLLHPKNKRIVSLFSSVTYKEAVKTSVKVKISIIPNGDQEFDHDFILDTNVDRLPVSDMVILDGSSRKGFWERLFNK
ncbi:hypothetical protein [Pedobacter sp. N23S346]|uniref:hypothetical protein n=1 Tax=Pedobacter sp. N23S346 TaxID=3402750 RepID=UPI003AD32348